MSKRPLPKKATKDNPAPHGHPNRYDNGCRCDVCRKGHRRWRLQWQAGLRPSRYVDPTASRRMVQALVANGFNMQIIGERMETGPTYLWRLVHGEVGAKNGLSHVTAARIAIVYRQMSEEIPPDNTPIERQNLTRSLNIARDNGWSTPEAWTDESIGDPKAKPFDWCPPEPAGVTDPDLVHMVLDTIEFRPIIDGSYRAPALWGQLKPADRVFVLRKLTDDGHGFNWIARNLGVHENAAKRWLKMRKLGEVVQRNNRAVLQLATDIPAQIPKRMPEQLPRSETRKKGKLARQQGQAVAA